MGVQDKMGHEDYRLFGEKIQKNSERYQLSLHNQRLFARDWRDILDLQYAEDICFQSGYSKSYKSSANNPACPISAPGLSA